MVAFLAGVGEWTPEGFRTTQFLLPSFAAERALLHALNAYLGDDAVLRDFDTVDSLDSLPDEAFPATPLTRM